MSGLQSMVAAQTMAEAKGNARGSVGFPDRKEN